MEEPLLTHALFQPFMKVVELAREQTLPSILEEVTRKRVKCVQLLFQLLPLYNYHLLKPLLQLLWKVASNKDSTRMNATCLAKLFAPVIMCPKTMSPEEFFTRVQHPAVELLSFIIEQEPVLFKLPDELVQDVIAFIKNEQDEQDHGTSEWATRHYSGCQSTRPGIEVVKVLCRLSKTHFSEVITEWSMPGPSYGKAVRRSAKKTQLMSETPALMRLKSVATSPDRPVCGRPSAASSCSAAPECATVQVVKTQLTFAIRREQSKEEIDDYTTRELARLYAHVSQQADTTPTKKLFLQRVQKAPSIQPATPKTPIASKAERILGLADTPDAFKRGLFRTSARYPIQSKAALVRSGSVDSLVTVDIADKENASPYAKMLKRKVDDDPAALQASTPTKFSRTPFQSMIRASMRVKAAVLTPSKKLSATASTPAKQSRFV
ncbi:rho GTPase-activating protein 19-like [Tropilaelaps mercedesae]|uniref:Rho GTPase-activating protein 19-like n=1 Tax=Tropilaelaps mercedesae TaxID=418985 RepID=A0A1V9X967_9ACAR|nr:rho GTPase-activating protein 19-like [Tropilaelaps mercedesae]